MSYDLAIAALQGAGIDFTSDLDLIRDNENLQQAIIALKNAGVDLAKELTHNNSIGLGTRFGFDNALIALRRNSELQQAVIILSQLRGLNSKFWHNIQFNQEAQQFICSLSQIIPESMPQEPSYQQAAQALASIAFDSFFSRRHRQHYQKAWQEIINGDQLLSKAATILEKRGGCNLSNLSAIRKNEQLAKAIITLDNSGIDFSGKWHNVLATIQNRKTGKQFQKAIALLNQAGLLPLSKTTQPGPFTPELLQAAISLHQAGILPQTQQVILTLDHQHMLSPELYEKIIQGSDQAHSATLVLDEENLLSQDNIKKVYSSNHPAAAAAKVLTIDALHKIATSAESLKRDAQYAIAHDLIGRVESQESSALLLHSLHNAARVASRPTRCWQKRSKLKPGSDKMPEPYKAAESTLEAARKLRGIPDEAWRHTLIGKHTDSSPYTTYNVMKDALKTEKSRSGAKTIDLSQQGAEMAGR
ncbi:hypothetical protein PsalN5692_00356 [Piscirickettsia salmonis]|uniref:hypothetical protein n=1 Tax=Piscirickettsia salmonis TaxID=1238 RepID=UPI0012B6DE2D|nr:hypothetical protein [Piscirickettsia salmonis]QGP48941.1 hypothetical protein PsalN5692_00356 [Piscirickettsia salmonis]